MECLDLRINDLHRILENLQAFSNHEHRLAFYFKGKEATHGSRYTDKFGFKDIGNHTWTSKLGQSITIAHQDLKDLVGNYMDMIMTIIVLLIEREYE